MPPPPPGSYGGGAAAAAVPNDSQAMLSLILGICSIVLCCWILGPVAFFLGQSSLNRINASNGQLGGAGLAQAGRILGIIGTVILALAILGVIVNILTGVGRTG